MSKQDVYEENPGFFAFYEKYGESVAQDVLERITELICDPEGSHEGLFLRDQHRLDVINSVTSGILDYDGIEWGFVIESGDRRGTAVLEWGPAEDVGTYKPPAPEKYYFVPDNDNLAAERPEMFNVYLAWRQPDGRIPEKEGKLNYDMFFAPGCKTWNYYFDWGNKYGLRISQTMPDGMTSWDQKPDWSKK